MANYLFKVTLELIESGRFTFLDVWLLKALKVFGLTFKGESLSQKTVSSSEFSLRIFKSSTILPDCTLGSAEIIEIRF
jgi:hypothetical protein